MNNKTVKHNIITIQTAIIGIAVIIFFSGVVLMYYNMVYQEKRRGIIKDGRMTASQASGEFDNYLSTNIDTINLSAYTLNAMIRENSTEEEIQEYLVRQSTAVKNAVQENYTGLYGYINGRFFSGTNWEPPFGYDATVRPWYKKPMEQPGELTILEPYHDIQSGYTMLAIGKTLCDGVSVISVDVSLDHMQKLTEDAVTNGGAEIEMILSGDGTVVTHSDINEVGKNYYREKDTLGAEVVRLLKSDNDGFFEFDYGGMRYIAYDAQFENDWHCVSVHDATGVFSSLTRITVMTIVLVIIIVIIVGILLVNSDRRRIQAERAVASNEAKTAFLSNMSHEIRTPINAVLGMNEMILRECEDDKILEYSESVKMSGQMLLGIVNDILDFSKIEAGRMDIIPAPYDLAALLTDLVTIIRTRAEGKSLILKLDFDKDTPKNLIGDEVRIKQIILNLLTNAVKYTEEGSIAFRITFDRDQAEPDTINLNVSVKDTGIGIKEEDLNKLFTEFERLEEERNRNIEGTGLGMNITQSLLHMMGSKLNVESVYGEGSEFSFSIKQKTVSEETLGDFEEAYRETLENHSRYKERFRAPLAEVIVVDDNPMNLAVFKSLLKKTELIIDTADSGDEGLSLMAGKKYDLIFLDHMMPEKDGIETLHELKKSNILNQATPVVCLTANAIAGARERYLGEGFDDYLTKPVDPEKLEKLILKYLPDEKIERITEEEGEAEAGNAAEIPEALKTLGSTGSIDVAKGIDNCGTLEDYLSLLRLFYTSIDEKQEEFKRFFAEKDIKNYTIKAHSLKSSANIIGAAAFGEESRKMEEAGKKGDIGYIEENHESYIEHYESFREPLKQALDESESERDKPEADPELIADVLEDIKDAAEEMDCERLFAIFREMEEYSITEEYAGLWKKLNDAVNEYDYSAITKLLENN